MKYSILTALSALAIIVASCSDGRKQLIRDYVQEFQGTKLDLDVRFKEIREVHKVTCNDSAEILKMVLQDKAPSIITGWQSLIKESLPHDIQWNKEQIEYYKREIVTDIRYGLASGSENSKRKIEEYQRKIVGIRKEISKDSIVIVNMKTKNDFTGTILEPLQREIAAYKATPDKVLLNQVSCTYSIKNPLLSNVVQTITKVFYFTPDNTSIVKSE